MAVKRLTLLSLFYSFQLVNLFFFEQQQSHDVEKIYREYDGTNGIQRYRIRIDHWGKLIRSNLRSDNLS